LRLTAASGFGAATGALSSVVVLDEALFAPDTGWRVAFFVGAMLAAVIYFMRLWIPESPRWLMDARSCRGRRSDRRRHRGKLSQSWAVAAAGDGAAVALARAALTRPCARSSSALLQLYPRRTLVGLFADGGSGLFLQRDFLHLCAGS